ncbi:ABC transporter permease [Ferrovibrio sp.]|uniref:ABC transporter permease n=1 Tax=Ferrovibrio sp. TaxID=1917215 RepID=UPI0025BB0F44|nr:ABC transporter permease [Ferrovibrio sp.]MBX3454993.1 ABC transporter permease [Ferrovibrio sp.]
MSLQREAGGAQLRLTGTWTLPEAARLARGIEALSLPKGERLGIEAGGLERLDTAGAVLLNRLVGKLGKQADVHWQNLKPEHQVLLDYVTNCNPAAAAPPPSDNGLVRFISHLGWLAIFFLREARRFIAFIGRVVEAAVMTMLRPRRLRLTSTLFHMEQTGLNALPIVGLISFLIGVVMAYQGADQLQQFGAEVFVVNLVAVSVLRELGILLTAIVVAGRSGSAFTAQIGSMKVNEEVDAIRTLGLDPIEVLVLPRVLALMLTLPLLTFFADIMGLLGGALMAWVALDITPFLFFERLHEAVTIWSFLVGMIKAPVFAALIAMVGCYEGLRVKRDAESVGRLTTRSVVQSIFLVIVADALFSIFFSAIGV